MNIEGFITLFAWFMGLWTLMLTVLSVAGAVVNTSKEKQLTIGWAELIGLFASWAWIFSR